MAESRPLMIGPAAKERSPFLLPPRSDSFSGEEESSSEYETAEEDYLEKDEEEEEDEWHEEKWHQANSSWVSSKFVSNLDMESEGSDDSLTEYEEFLPFPNLYWQPDERGACFADAEVSDVESESDSSDYDGCYGNKNAPYAARRKTRRGSDKLFTLEEKPWFQMPKLHLSHRINVRTSTNVITFYDLRIPTLGKSQVRKV